MQLWMRVNAALPFAGSADTTVRVWDLWHLQHSDGDHAEPSTSAAQQPYTGTCALVFVGLGGGVMMVHSHADMRLHGAMPHVLRSEAGCTAGGPSRGGVSLRVCDSRTAATCGSGPYAEAYVHRC
jgi:hypothetical protein